MNRKLLQLNLWVTAILLVLTLILNGAVFENWAFVISALSLLTLGIQVYSLVQLGYGIFDFLLYFFLFSHVFMFGNIYLIAVDKVNLISWRLIFRYDVAIVVQAATFVLMYLHTLLLGMVFFDEQTISKVKDRLPKWNQVTRIAQVQALWSKVSLGLREQKDSIFKTGVGLAIISVPCRLFIDVNNVIAAQTSGSYYSVGTSSGFVDDLATLFVPAFLFVLNSSASKRTKHIITAIFVLYSTIIMILTGDRRYQFIGILIVGLNYLYVNKVRFNFVKLGLLGVVGIVGLNLLTQISAIRQEGLVSLTTFFVENWTALFSLDFIFKILGEFGLSFMTVVFALKNMPLVLPYQLGFSFLGSLPAILPIGWAFPTFFDKVSIFKALNGIEGYPVGASFPGELYANFGWLSLLLVFLLGFVVVKTLKMSKMDTSLKVSLYFGAFFILINIVRASFLEITRNLFMVLVFPLVLFYAINWWQTRSAKMKKEQG